MGFVLHSGRRRRACLAVGTDDCCLPSCMRERVGACEPWDCAQSVQMAGASGVISVYYSVSEYTQIYGSFAAPSDLAAPPALRSASLFLTALQYSSRSLRFEQTL